MEEESSSGDVVRITANGPILTIQNSQVGTIIVQSTNFSESGSEASTSSVNDDGMELFYLQSECAFLFHSNKFENLLPKLKKLLDQQSNGWFKLETMLMITECTIRTESKTESRKRLEETISMITSERKHNLNDLLSLAQRYARRSSCIFSVITYVCACKLHLLDSPPSVAIAGIMECFRSIRSSIQEMGYLDRSKEPTADVAVYFMQSMLEVLNDLRGIESNVKAEHEAICMNNTGIVFTEMRKYKQAREYYIKAKERMDDEFKDRASKFYVYGAIVNNLGCIEARKGNFSKARAHFQEGVEHWRNADNFPDEGERREWLRSGKQNLDSVTEKVGVVEKFMKRLQ